MAAPRLTKALEAQHKAVNAALEAGGDPADAVKATEPDMRKALTEVYEGAALVFAKMMVRSEVRAEYNARLMKAITQALAAEAIIETDLSLIQATTVEKIIAQVTYGINAQMTIAQISQAIADTGAFSPERALRIARTATGTAMSVGQLEAGKAAGATHKKWLTSHHETRDWHTKREGETVPINGRFSAYKGVGPRYPCDPQVDGADRINCRCWLTFEIKAKTPPKPTKPPKPKAVKPPPAKVGIPTTAAEGVTTAAEAEALGAKMADDILAIANEARGGGQAAAHLRDLGALEFRQSLEAHLAKDGIKTGFSTSSRLKVGKWQYEDDERLTKEAIAQAGVPLPKVLPKRLDDLLGQEQPVQVFYLGGNRAYYQRAQMMDAFNENPAMIHTSTARSTVVHEYFHHIQAVAPGFDDILQRDFAIRTAGEKSVSLKAWTNVQSFGDDEVAFPDQYPEAYYGRWYGKTGIPGRSGALEVASMTGEALFGGDPLKYKQLMTKAPELAHTFLGALYHGKLTL